jgi:alkaline phosphatase D
MRTFKSANSENRQTTLDASSLILGPAQLEWLKRGLKSSAAAWKVVAADLPLGLVVPDGPGRFEAVANDDSGVPLGREIEIANLLSFIKRERIHNVVWITADVHYCAAHQYHPTRAKFTDFDPFWEFVAGPLNAGTFGPNQLDATFGPEVKFLGIPPGMKPNRPPSDGFQFFGTLNVNARTKALTAQLHDLSGKTLYSIDLAPMQP